MNGTIEEQTRQVFTNMKSKLILNTCKYLSCTLLFCNIYWTKFNSKFNSRNLDVAEAAGGSLDQGKSFLGNLQILKFWNFKWK